MTRNTNGNNRTGNERIANQLENLVSHGHPTCDVCSDADNTNGDRCPEELYVGANNNGGPLRERFPIRVCETHRDALTNARITHTITATVEPATDHNMNDTHRYDVRNVEQEQ